MTSSAIKKYFLIAFIFFLAVGGIKPLPTQGQTAESHFCSRVAITAVTTRLTNAVTMTGGAAFNVSEMLRGAEFNITQLCYSNISECLVDTPQQLQSAIEAKRLGGLGNLAFDIRGGVVKGYHCSQVPANDSSYSLGVRQLGQEKDVSLAGPETCSLGLNFSLWACVKSAFAGLVQMFLWLFNQILLFFNTLFNYALRINTELLGKYINDRVEVNDAGEGVVVVSGVNIVWKLGRDLANLFFIFILLIAAIGKILDLGNYKDKKFIIHILIIALLINFSMILPKVIIDASNILSNTFYRQMGKPGHLGAPDIGVRIIEKAKPQFALRDQGAFISVDNPDNINHPEEVSLSSIITRGIGGIILMLGISYVLAIMTFLLLARAVILVVLVATSSIAVFSWAIPEFRSKVWSKWWDALVCQALFLPAFLFLLYLALQLIDTIPKPTAGWIEDTANYAIVLGMALSAVFISRKVACSTGFGSTITNKLGDWGKGFGTNNIVGRQTVGMAATKMANSATVKSLAASSPLFGGALRSGLQKVEGLKFGSEKDGKTYTEGQKKRAEDLAAVTKDFSGKQKTQFIKKADSLLGQVYGYTTGQPSAGTALYQGMDEKDRAKLEKEYALTKAEIDAEKAYKDYQEGRRRDKLSPEEEEAYTKAKEKREQADHLAKLRSKLSPSERIKTEVERLRGIKDAEAQLQAFQGLDEKIKTKVLEDSSDSTVARLNTTLQNLSKNDSENKTTKDTLAAFTDAFGGLELERRQKIQDLTQKETLKNALGEVRKSLDEDFRALDSITDSEQRGEKKKTIANTLKTSRRGTIASLDAKQLEHIINDPRMILALGKSGAFEVANNKALTPEQLDKFYQTVEEMVPKQSSSAKTITDSADRPISSHNLSSEEMAAGKDLAETLKNSLAAVVISRAAS